uniref:Uncharacterized protein n=1 Tax=Sphaerodactylus townsendi TaxID=933632 RepID=A0ACB8FPY4_9SAUR
MPLAEKREKSCSFPPMMIEEDAALRNGSRGLSGQWADTAAARPRTTERHITVHKRLVLGFAVSILALLLVTMIAVLLSVRIEECSSGDADSAAGRAGNGSVPAAAGSARQNRNHAGEPPGRGGVEPAGGGQDEEEEEWQRRQEPPPWTQLRLPGPLRPLHYNLMLSVFMENFTFGGEVNVQVECLNATRYIVLHAHRVHIEAVRVAEDRLAGALRVSSFFLYPQTQVFVVVLNRSLEALRSYNLKILYHAPIENELLGFFRSSYVLYGERRKFAK